MLETTTYGDEIKKEYLFISKSFGGEAIGWQEHKYKYIGEIKNNMFNGHGNLFVLGKAEYDLLYEGGFVDGKYDGQGALYWDIESANFKNGSVYGKYTRYYSNGEVNDYGECYDGIIVSNKFGYDNSNATMWTNIEP